VLNSGKVSDIELKLLRYKALCALRALHETIVVNLGKMHGAVLTGLGNEAAPLGVLLGMIESMTVEDFILSPKCGDQRSQMAIAVATDLVLGQSEHDHSYMLLYNHLQRKGVEDGNVHWGCLEHGIWPFFTSDMMRVSGLIAGAAWEARRYLKNPVGLYMFGEGAASQGVAHEVLTWICAQNYRRNAEELKKYDKMPLSERAKKFGVLRPFGMILGMQVNNWSIYTDTLDEHGGRSKRDSSGKSRFALWAESYGLRGVDVEGDNLEEVILRTKEAVSFAREDVPVSTMLILHMRMRRTGHNEHQISRSDEARANRQWEKSSILFESDSAHVSEREMKALWDTEPIKIYVRYLADLDVAGESVLKEILENERKAMDLKFAHAETEPLCAFEDSIYLRSREHFMFKPHDWKLPERERPLDEMLSGGTTTDRALLNVISEFMEEDEGVTYQGEDVGSGGVLVATRRLQQKFGPERVFDSPIAEEAIIGTTAGASIMRSILRMRGVVKTAGTKICEIQFMPFNGDAHAIMRTLAPNWYQKKMPTAFIDIEHYGIVHGGGSGHYHSDCMELHYVNMPGIAVVCPSDAYDLVGLMRAARESEWPVVFMSPIWSYGEQECAAKIPQEKYLIPIGKAAVKRHGKDITVVTYGTSVRAALREAEFLAKDGIDLEIVDLRSLAPFDTDTVFESAKKTGRVVVMTEASVRMGEWLRGKIFLNSKINDALRRSRKPMQNKSEGIEDFQRRVGDWVRVTGDNLFSVSNLGKSPDIYDRLPYIPVLSRGIAPIASGKDAEWQDLPFEEYADVVKNERGDEIPKKHLRSARLALIARELMRY